MPALGRSRALSRYREALVCSSDSHAFETTTVTGHEVGSSPSAQCSPIGDRTHYSSPSETGSGSFTEAGCGSWRPGVTSCRPARPAVEGNAGQPHPGAQGEPDEDADHRRETVFTNRDDFRMPQGRRMPGLLDPDVHHRHAGWMLAEGGRRAQQITPSATGAVEAPEPRPERFELPTLGFVERRASLSRYRSESHDTGKARPRRGLWGAPPSRCGSVSDTERPEPCWRTCPNLTGFGWAAAPGNWHRGLKTNRAPAPRPVAEAAQTRWEAGITRIRTSEIRSTKYTAQRSVRGYSGRMPTEFRRSAGSGLRRITSGASPRSLSSARVDRTMQPGSACSLNFLARALPGDSDPRILPRFAGGPEL